MHATPRAVLKNLHLVGGRVLFQKFAVIRNLGRVAMLNMIESIGKRHFTEVMMMAIAFSIGCNVEKLIPLASVRESAQETIREMLPIIEQPFKSDGTCNGAVIKEETHPPARGQTHLIRAGGINAIATHIFPGAATDLAHAACLS